MFIKAQMTESIARTLFANNFFAAELQKSKAGIFVCDM